MSISLEIPMTDEQEAGKTKRAAALVNWSQCRKYLEAAVTKRHAFWKWTQVQKPDIVAHLEGLLRTELDKIAQRQVHRGKTISMTNAGYVQYIKEGRNGADDA